MSTAKTTGFDISRASHVELHDAQIKNTIIEPGGNVAIAFSHIAIYISTCENRYDVWSCEARLSLKHTHQLVIDGEQRLDDWIMNGYFYTSAGDPVEPDLITGSSECSRLSIKLTGSGCSMDIRFGHAKIEDVKPIEKLEQWSGSHAE